MTVSTTTTAGHHQSAQWSPGFHGEGVERQTDEHKQGGIHEEHQRFPEGVGLQPAASRKGAAAAVPAQIQPGCDRRQHPRRVNLLGRQIGDVGQEDRAGDLHRRIIDAVSQPPTDEAHRQADGGPDQGGIDDASCCVDRREVTGGGDGDGRGI